MILILHAQPGREPVRCLPPIRDRADFILLAGAERAFDDLPLPEPAGRVGGAVLRLTLCRPQPSAVALLSDCLQLCGGLLGEYRVGLRYVLAGTTPEGEDARPPAAVTWTTDPSGTVTGAHLSAEAATWPLLGPVLRDLGCRPMTDDRRLAFLSAAFAGA